MLDPDNDSVSVAQTPLRAALCSLTEVLMIAYRGMHPAEELQALDLWVAAIAWTFPHHVERTAGGSAAGHDL